MTIEPGLYKHYKGNTYEVLGMARYSETLESMVVYKATDQAGEVWVRPAAMFMETLMVEGTEKQRFEKIG